MNKRQRGPRLVKTSRLRVESDIAVGEQFSGRAKALAATGNALVEHPSGVVFFVAGAWQDELISVRVQEVKKGFGSAELLDVLEASPHRRTAPCIHHGVGKDACGGCPWMFMDEPAQLQAKQVRVQQALARIDSKVEVAPIWASKNALGYRIRAQLKTDGEQLGFVPSGQKHLAPVQDCLVLTAKNRQTLIQLRGLLPNADWRPKAKQRLTTLDIDENRDAHSVSVNQRLPFQQANAEQNQRIRDWLSDRLRTIPVQDKALELFAGSGNFTEILSQAAFKQILAVELMPEAVAALNAKQLVNVQAQTCDLFNQEAFADLVEQNQDANLLVLDPPRDGLKLKEGLLRKKNKSLRDIIYISCDLATFSRDMADLYQRGFILKQVQPVDMFPQTPHVELLAHLQRKH